MLSAEVRRRLSVGLPALIAASIGLLYGYDLSCIAGALLFITDQFGLTTSQQELLTTMAVLGQIGGALVGGRLADAMGRKRSTVLIAVCFALFALLDALSVSMPMLLTARLLIGVTIGVSVVVIPVYVAELAPAALRGALGTAYQLAIVGGIILGYLAAYLLADTHSWRWIFGLAAILAALLLPLLMRLPETARWYVLKGRVADARRALLRVSSEAGVEPELAEITGALDAAKGPATSGLSEMLRRPYLRATVFVITLGVLSQISGINAIIYYSPRLFETMGFQGNFAKLGVPALLQIGAVVAVCAAIFLVDRVGRRPVLLCGIAMMVVADALLMGAYAGRFAVMYGVVGVLVFLVGFNFGFGSLVWVYAGEAFPTRLRSTGSSTMLTFTLTANAIIAASFLTMTHSLGGAGTFAVFGCVAVAALVLVYRYAPETKGRQLEQIRHFWENGGRWP
ncbi:sugar porter family MFS transporter [Mycobacterium conspicuum]|uniref:sugar porter family MFS transporter n=1 Tax=Mycobacterium conspicuum TaxID=44010 RepID=UPI00355889C4